MKYGDGYLDSSDCLDSAVSGVYEITPHPSVLFPKEIPRAAFLLALARVLHIDLAERLGQKTERREALFMGGVVLKKWVHLGGILILLVLLSSCAALAPVIQVYSEIGVTRADRARLLERDVKAFHEALYWGQIEPALQLAEAEQHQNLRKEIRRRKDKERLVESKMSYVELDEDGYLADVEVTVRYYEVPFYVVKERTEKEKWKFNTGTGWTLLEKEDFGEQASAEGKLNA